jgi:V8-like Glu-specific endopeptidase
VKQLIWESPPDKLDAVLLEVEDLPPDALPPAAVPAKEIGAAARIYIWGYPASKPVWLSNEDNDVQEVKAPYFYYDAFAESGSSGSPVFDVETHDLVGMHRGESHQTGRRQAVAFELVLRAARKELSEA